MFHNFLRVSCQLISKAPLLKNPGKFLSNATVNYCQTTANTIGRPRVNRLKTSHERDDDSFLLRQHDPDVFGDIGGPQVQENERDDDDLKEEEFLENPPNRSKQLGMRQYADMMKDYLQQKKVHEAINVLEHRMLKEDRAQPTNYIYNILIGGCARLGYDKKAFQLYTNMKQRQLKVTGATYTNLFNACANSPFPTKALQKALHLRETILESGFVLNTSNYNSMIKAFGRCGDIRMAFQMVDEMQTQKLPVRVETYNFLLQACASDRELGFRHALIIWRKMYRRRMEIDYYCFNLMLRCVRDCGLGDPETTERLIKEIIDLSVRPKQIGTETSETKEILTIGETQIDQDTVKVPVTIETTEPVTTGFNMPNLLSQTPQLGNLISIAEVTKPEERLLLLGGVTGFLNEIDKHKAKPDIKTFTQLLEIIPSTLESEKKLLRIIRERGIHCDIDFFNNLIKKRALRNDFDGARRVLSMVKTAGLRPDIVTYGVLALACESEHDADSLLSEMETKGIRMNIEILGAMLRKAGYAKNFSYILHILRLIVENDFKPNPILLKNIYKIKGMCSKMSKEGHPEQDDRRFREEIKKFRFELNDLLDKLGIRGMTFEEAVRKYKVHPYKQFKEPTELGGFEEEKNVNKRRWRKPTGTIRRDVE